MIGSYTYLDHLQLGNLLSSLILTALLPSADPRQHPVTKTKVKGRQLLFCGRLRTARSLIA